MAYASMLGGGYGATTAVIPNAHGDTVSVPDAELLFTGDFRRAGPDLVLTGQDGRHHLVPGYFSGEKKPALVAPNGASLSPDLVDLLAGSPAPGQYAQAQQTTPPDAIGKVEKAIGNVTAIRNGVAVALHVGDPVFKSDVIVTGSNSSAGVGFPDGTALNLIANTRMALNEYSYDPNGTSNVALVSLVQGTFAFVAGRVAHTGDMKIETPVATMGIRGTTGWVQEVASVTANLGNVTYSFAVVDDFNSTGHGQYDLIDANGNVIATVSQTGYVTYVTPQGIGQPPLVSTAPMSNSQLGFEQQIIQQVFGVLNSINNPNPNPQSTPGTPGSGTPPNQLNDLPHLLQEGAGQQFAVNIPLPGLSGATVPGTVTFGSSTQQQQAAEQNNNPTSTVSWTSTTGGNWSDGSNWSDGQAPQAPQNVAITQPVKVTIDGAEAAASLVIGPGGVLNIVPGGEFIVAGGISNSGVLQLNSSGGDPQLVIDGTVYLLDGGAIEFKGPAAQNLVTGLAGSGATLVNVDNTIEGSGIIGQGDGALTLVNGSAATIDAVPLLADDTGALTIDTGNTVSNSGLLEATASAFGFGAGTLQIEDNVTNIGAIEAVGEGAKVELFGVTVSGGIVETSSGGVIETAPGTGASTLAGITAADGTTLEATDGTTLHLSGTTTLDGVLALYSDGTGSFTLASGDQIVAASGANATLENFGTISGAGEIGSGDLTLTVQNETSSAVIDADVANQTLTIDTANGTGNSNKLLNAGTLEATNNGELSVHAVVDNSNGQVNADGGFVDFLLGITGGNATISDGGKLEYGWSSNVATAFSGSGILVLDHQAISDANSYTGTITGFAAGDTIDLTDIPDVTGASGTFLYYDSATDTLTVTDPQIAGDSISIKLSGTYTQNNFVLTSDPSGNAEVLYQAVTPPPPTSDEWINTSGGAWTTGSDWGNGAPPSSTMDAVVDLSGTHTVTIATSDTGDAAKSLTISDTGATLRGSGALTVGTLVNYGRVEAGQGDDLTIDELDDGSKNYGTIEAVHGGTLTIDHSGSATNEQDGTIKAVGHDSRLTLEDVTSDENDGTIEATHGGTVTINLDGVGDSDTTGGNLGTIKAAFGGTVSIVGGMDNKRNHGSTGTIEAIGRGSRVDFSANSFGHTVDNDGKIEAKDQGRVEFSHLTVDNERHGSIAAEGPGSKIKFSRDDIDNWGSIAAAWGGTVLFAYSFVDNAWGGTIAADGRGSQVEFDRDRVDNSGHIEAEHRGEVSFYESHVDNKYHGTIEADGRGSQVKFDRDQIDNSGRIEATHRGEVSFYDSRVDNDRYGTVAADGRRSEVKFDHDHVDNRGAITAAWGGTVLFAYSSVDNAWGGTIAANGRGSEVEFDRDRVDNSGRIEAENRGEVSFYESHVDNKHQGSIEADGRGSQVKFDRDYVDNSGRIEAERHGDVTFYESHVDNAHHATIEADGWGSEVKFDRDHVDNDGRVEALHHGAVSIDESHVDNARRGIIAAEGWGSKVNLKDDRIDNWGSVAATWGGMVLVTYSHFDNAGAGTIIAEGRDSKVNFYRDDIDNSGRIEAKHNGEVSFYETHVDNDRHGVIEADGWGSEVKFDRSHLDNDGRIEAEHHGKVSIDESRVDNYRHGVIDADGWGAEIKFDRDHIDNDGRIEAEHHGRVSFYETHIDNGWQGAIEVVGYGSAVDIVRSHVDNDGRIEAKYDGTINIAHSTVDQGCDGVIAAFGNNSAVNLDDATIVGGTLETNWGGLIQTSLAPWQSFSNSTLDDVTIASGTQVQIDDNTSLTLQGTVDNHGTITIGTPQTVHEERDLVIDGSVSLTGGGNVVLTPGDTNSIIGVSGGDGWNVLANVDNTISGDGTIGYGDDQLALTNGGAGTIDANVSGETLALHTGNTIDNYGTLEATSDGILDIEDSVDNIGVLSVNGGTILLDQNFTFQTGIGGESDLVTFGSDGGTLQLENAANFTGSGGTVSGFAAGDVIDLTDISYAAPASVASGSTLPETDIWNGTTLTVANGTQTATLNFSGSYQQDNFALTNDTGTGTDVILSPVTVALSGLNSDDDGNAVEGQALTVDVTLNGSAAAPDSLTYTWFDNGTIVQTGTSDSYAPTDTNPLTVLVSFTDPNNANQTDTVTVLIGVDASAPPPPQTDYWQGPTTDSEWTDSGNWTLDAPPSDQPAFIGSDATVDVDTTTSVDDVNLTNGGSIDVSGAVLTLDDDTTISGGGQLNITATGTVAIVTGSDGSGATFDGIDVTISGGAVMSVDSSASGAVLTLDDNTSISGGGGGELNIVATGKLDVIVGDDGPGSGATLDGVNVEVATGAVVSVDPSASGAVLTLDDGTMISGGGSGTLTISSTGELDVEYGTSGPGATLDGVMVTDNGAVEVDTHALGAVLTLDDGTMISGGGSGTLTISSTGELDVQYGTSGPGATLDGVEIVNSGGLIQIHDSATLTIADTVTLLGDGTVSLASTGDPTAIVGTLDVSEIHAQFENDGNMISGVGAIGDGTGDLALTNESGVIDANVSGAILSLDTGNPISNDGTLEATNGGILQISDAVNGTGVIEVFGGTVDLTDSNAASDNVTFNGAGTLQVDNSPSGGTQIYTGTISGFGVGDTLDLGGFNYHSGDALQTATSYNGTDTILTITDSTQHTSASVSLAGNYTATNDIDWSVASDGNGGLDATTSTPTVDSWWPYSDDGDWFDTLNWRSGAVPGQTNEAEIAGSVSGVTFSSSSPYYSSSGATVGELVVSNGDTLDISSGTLTVLGTVSDEAGWIGADGGTLKLEGLVTNTGVLQAQLGGTLDIDGGVDNTDGTIAVVGVGTSATIEGTVANTGGSIAVGSTTLTLSGAEIDGGNINPNGTANDPAIVDVGTGGATLDDVIITNENTSTFEISVSSDLLALDGATITGGTVINDGTFEVTGGTVDVNAPETGSGSYTIAAGSTLEFNGSVAAGASVEFMGSTGTLVLADPSSFGGEVTGITGSGDIIDLGSFGAGSNDQFTTSTTYNGTTNTTLLAVTDTSNNARESVTLAGNETTVTWTATNDNKGGADVSDPPAVNSFATATATANGDSGTIIFADGDTNPQTASATPEGANYLGSFSVGAVSESNGTASLAWTFDLGHDQINLAAGQTETQTYGVTVADGQNTLVNQTVSVSIGGPGNDNFVFAPGVGADTIVNFNPQQNTIELDHFANIQSLQQVAAAITTDAHGDAVIELGHNDSITLPGVRANYLQQHLQSMVHVHA